MNTKKPKKAELTLSVMKEKLGVCRLEKDRGKGHNIPDWATRDGFYSLTKTADELSVVCPEKNIPEGVRCEPGWRGLKVEGPLDFGLIGILAALSTLLAEEGISLFALSTYDTDYVLVKEETLEKAVKALSDGGHKVLSAPLDGKL